MSAIELASSPLIRWLDVSLLLARLLAPLALAAAIAGTFQRGPKQRDRTRLEWWGLGVRVVVTACLLVGWRRSTGYEMLIGWLWDATTVAVDLKTSDGWRELGELVEAIWANQGEPQWSLPPVDSEEAGPALVRAGAAAMPMLGQSCLFGVSTLGRILGGGLLLTGPVVAALSLARTSDLLGQWVRATAAVLSWPWLATAMVTLAGAILPAVGSGESAATPAAGLGISLIGAAAWVPWVSWRLTGALAGVLAPSRRLWSTLARLSSGRPRARAHERAQRRRRARSPTRDRDLQARGREWSLAPAQRGAYPGQRGSYPAQRGSVLEDAPSRATPPMPHVGLGFEPFGAAPRFPVASSAGALNPVTPSVVPAEVRHGVRPVDPSALEPLPASPEDPAAAAALQAPRPPTRPAREARRPVIELPEGEQTRPLVPATDSVGPRRHGVSAPGSTRATAPMETPAPSSTSSRPTSGEHGARRTPHGSDASGTRSFVGTAEPPTDR